MEVHMCAKRYVQLMRFTIGLLLILVLVPTAGTQAQSNARCFSETGQCISGVIRTYWEQNGGLPVFGLPLGPQQEVVAEDGVKRQSQLFERHRLEVHPENNPPYNVLLGRIGFDRLVQQGRDWQSFPKANPSDGNAAGCRFFSETSHTVCGAFWEAFRSYGLGFANTPGISYAESLALFGLPLSQPITEQIDGKEYTVQWFERARFELHPENQPPFNVLFGRLGAEVNGNGGNGSAGAALQGKTWELVSYGPVDGQIPAAASATLAFDGQQVAGSSGCNSFSGPYTATASTITFGRLVSTLRACAEAIARQESAIFTAFDGERPYTINGNTLRITYDSGKQALTYRVGPTGAAALQRGSWQLVSYGPTNGIQTPAVGQATLSFADRVTGSTGCNNFGGPYTASDSEINFGVIVSTLVGCTSDGLNAQEQAIFAALQGVRPYTIGDGQLRIIYDNGRQALNYRAVSP
jgi:heat shock protein HslJ